jgi:8-oxo-dGTP pyrophosphatase MutT (NUDIX family)
MSNLKHFNLRVYALIENDKGNILLSDEYVLNQKMTKFPGGGMHFGEGPADCLRREAMEEFGQPLNITGHFYTTHFFQQTLFYDDHQLISIYYRARFTDPVRFRISVIPFDFPPGINGSQSFRWADPAGLKEEDLTFPIDRYVLKMLQNPVTPGF